MKHNWINDEIKIDFPLPKSLQNLINKLEELDAAEDYSYFNVSEALDCGAKELVLKGKLTQAQWDLLCAKYEGVKMEEHEKTVKYYKMCRVTCKRCGTVMERTYTSPDDHGGRLMTCTCGAFTFDPSPLWPRLSWVNDVDPATDCEEYYKVEWE